MTHGYASNLALERSVRALSERAAADPESMPLHE